MCINVKKEYAGGKRNIATCVFLNIFLILYRSAYLSLEKSRVEFLWALSLYELLAVPDIQSAVNRIDNAPAHEVVCGEVCGIFIH